MLDNLELASLEDLPILRRKYRTAMAPSELQMPSDFASRFPFRTAEEANNPTIHLSYVLLCA